MGQILLLDADAKHAGQIADVLRCISCQTTICVELQSAISMLQRQLFDAVVVVSNPGMDWDLRVEFLRHAVFQMLERPHIVCLLRGSYSGPNERVYAARKGFKVIYEQ